MAPLLHRAAITRAKVVLSNMHRTQAPEITRGRDGMLPSAAAALCLQQAHYHSYAASG